MSAVTPVSPGRFVADLHALWTIGGRPNGGYLLAVLARCVVPTGPHEHVVAASAHYLRAPEPGPVTVDVEVLRTGRSASQARARMTQDGQHCVEALFTLARLEPGGPAQWDAGLPGIDLPERDTCLRVPGLSPGGVAVPIMDQVDLRLDPATAGFATGSPSGRGVLRGWLSLPDDEPFDPVSLLYAVDAFPPATFDIGPSGWVPTLELTVYLRALPVPGPVRVQHRAQLVQAGRVDEDCVVWDADGNVVAHSTQLAGIRLG